MRKVVRKAEVEEVLRNKITDSQFQKALEYAEQKQEYIYQQSKNPVVLQHWYLVKLTEEYVRNLAFSEFTLSLCVALRNVEKEHPAGAAVPKMNNHIVSVPAGKIK